jgi:uncharacterized membrane protein YuzA (DUF378 family)
MNTYVWKEELNMRIFAWMLVIIGLIPIGLLTLLEFIDMEDALSDFFGLPSIITPIVYGIAALLVFLGFFILKKTIKIKLEPNEKILYKNEKILYKAGEGSSGEKYLIATNRRIRIGSAAIKKDYVECSYMLIKGVVKGPGAIVKIIFANGQSVEINFGRSGSAEFLDTIKPKLIDVHNINKQVDQLLQATYEKGKKDQSPH